MSQWNYSKLEIGIIDNLMRQWIGFEDFKILNSSNILKFAIVIKVFEFFCSSSLTIITGQRSFSSLSDWLLDITPETKICFEPSYCKIWKLFKNFSIFCKFLKYQLFDLITNKARKLKVTESNQSRASLTKPWLATNKANRSPVVWEQFARR